jgi:hypothetical protein
MSAKVKKFHSPFALLLVLGLAALLLAACSSSAAATAPANFGANSQAGGATKAQPISAASAAPAVPDAGATPLVTGSSLIIKTGQLTLQVSNVDASAAQANGIVTGAGGYIAGSSRSGDADKLFVSVTYRIPVAKWDTTLDAIHHASGGGTISIIDEQIQTQDVTAAAVDLDARLTNLRSTESALLAIMAKADKITDILAVQEQLTTVQGQIEELQAQRNTLGDQASYSTLTVQFQAVPKTETTTAAGGWNLGSTIDDATAALVKVGQAAATIAVWALIVGGPLIVVLLILFVLYRAGRRLRRRLDKKVTSA